MKLSKRNLKIQSAGSQIVSFDDLFEKLKKRQDSLSKNRLYNKEIIIIGLNTLSKLDQLRKKKGITVHLELPEEILKKIGTGKAFRKGGIVRLKSGKIAKHLSEVKPSKIKDVTKLVNIAFIAVTILETHLVDEKLYEILTIVRDIDAKLDAQNRGKFKSAIEQMKDLSQIQDTEIRDKKIAILEDKFCECANVFEDIYIGKKKMYENLNSKFHKALISNKKEFEKMMNLSLEIQSYLEVIILCKVAQAYLPTLQNRFINGQQKSYDLLNYIAGEVEDFRNKFGEEALVSVKKQFKDPIMWDKKRYFQNLGKQMKELNKQIEHLLNACLLFPLTIPEEKKHLDLKSLINKN